jgi:hypothetical protein
MRQMKGAPIGMVESLCSVFHITLCTILYICCTESHEQPFTCMQPGNSR